MKEVYIPTKNELLELQNLGINVYRYLLSKGMEALVMEDVIYGEKNMFETAYETLPEFREILPPLARMYPERIKESEKASTDIDLCQKMLKPLSRKNDFSIYQLDNLIYFNQDTKVLHDARIIKTVSSILEEELPSTPKYRFDYQEPNILLDDIFSCRIPLETLEKDALDNLLAVDPIYAVKYLSLPEEKRPHSVKGLAFLNDMAYTITKNTLRYVGRYGLEGITEYRGKDIVNAPDAKVKKLVRYLEQHKNNYQK